MIRGATKSNGDLGGPSGGRRKISGRMEYWKAKIRCGLDSEAYPTEHESLTVIRGATKLNDHFAKSNGGGLNNSDHINYRKTKIRCGPVSDAYHVENEC